MEIYSKISDQNKNMQFNPLEIENNKKIINPYMNNYSNYMIKSTQESNPFNTGRLSYNIILKSSLDKAKRNSKKDNYLYNNSNINDITNTSTNNMKSNNDISLNIQMDKDDIDEKNNKDYNIVNQNFLGNNNLNDIERIKVEEKQINSNEIVMDEYYENNFDRLNNRENNNYDNSYNKNEENINNNYYNPFKNKNMNTNSIINRQNNLTNNSINKIGNNIYKIPIITLTAFQPQKNTNFEKENKFSKFLNLISYKRPKKQSNEESKLDEIEIPSKNSKINNDRDIEKLKSELSGKENINKDKNEENEENLRKNIDLDNDINDNNKCFIIKAEPILNSDNKNDMNNSSDEENNLNNSSQMIDIDKSSEYTLQTGTNIDILIRKKSRFSSLLMGILLGSCALFYFLYKKIKLKEILSKLSQLCKQTPEFLKNILSYIGIEFEDVFEEYDDANKLFFGILCVISFWSIFKSLMLKLVKRRNN